MATKRRLTASVWFVVAVVLATGVVGGIYRGVKHHPDWDDLQSESRYVWEHGHTALGTAMFGYLPTATFALWPFTTWLPEPVGLVLYVATNLAAILASIWIVARWWIERPVSLVWPVLLVCANFQHALQSNQLTAWTLLLCVAGLTLVGPVWHRPAGESTGQRPVPHFLGGAIVGLATLIKTMPALLVAYMLLRRRWWALVGVATAIVLFDLLPSAAFFGWRGTLDEHRAWLQRVAWHSNRQLIEQPLQRVHRHGTNASLAAVLARWLRATPNASRQVILYGNPPPDVIANYRASLEPDQVLTLDPMPPRDGPWAVKEVDIAWVPRMHVADLPAELVWWIWATPLIVGFGALAFYTWRAGAGVAHWAPLSALWMLAMFWPSPMTRHYYLAWAFPAIVVVWQMVVHERQQRAWTAYAVIAAAALAGWLVGVAGLGSNLLRWYGLHLVVLALLTAATACAWRRSRVTRISSAGLENAASIA